MRRLLLNILSAAFVLLFILLLYSWIRSYLPPGCRIESHRGRLMLIFWDGYLPVTAENFVMYDPGHPQFFGVAQLLQKMTRESQIDFLGFSSTRGSVLRGIKLQIIAIPIWLPLVLCAIIATLLIVARRRLYHRLQSGHCLKCGYDLRESKDNCPECGAAIAAAPATSPSSHASLR